MDRCSSSLKMSSFQMNRISAMYVDIDKKNHKKFLEFTISIQIKIIFQDDETTGITHLV